MTWQEFDEFRKAFDAECAETLGCKGVEYGGRGDRLANFKGEAAQLGLKPEQIWAVYFMKHIRSIMSYVREGKVFSEAIRSRFMDARNYIDLGLALVEEPRDA